MLFHSGHGRFAPWPPCRVLAEHSEFPRVTVLVALSSHTLNKREEGEQHPGNTLFAKALDLVEARNLLVAPPLPFFSQLPLLEGDASTQPLTVPSVKQIEHFGSFGVSQGQSCN